MKKKVILILCLLLCALLLSGCGDTAKEEPAKLSFRSAASYESLKALDGKPVAINGYMATSSPADGSFIFLMNLPYQSCPFCKPNTSQLSNTMEVYPPKGKTFGYTTQAIQVTGKLQVAPDENSSFTDPYGYEFNFKIVDAEYHILSADELSGDMALWQRVADSGIINDLYAMQDYVDFLCRWPTYFVNSYEDADGNIHPGYYLYAVDAMNYLTQEGAQYRYGRKDGYFDVLIDRIKKLDPTRLNALVRNVEQAKLLAADALRELEEEHYTSEYKFVEQFQTEDYVFTLDKGQELSDRVDALYLDFADWLGSWEL